jgi:hypothetical protein
MRLGKEREEELHNSYYIKDISGNGKHKKLTKLQLDTKKTGFDGGGGGGGGDDDDDDDDDDDYASSSSRFSFSLLRPDRLYGPPKLICNE